MQDKNSCIFCRIAKGEIESKFVGESDNFFAIMDANPIVEGHTLIIPKKHFVTILDIPDKLGNEMLSFIKKVSGKLLDDKFGNGFNILMNNLEVAGQEVMHVHIHIIPREEKDGIKFYAKFDK